MKVFVTGVMLDTETTLMTEYLLALRIHNLEEETGKCHLHQEHFKSAMVGCCGVVPCGSRGLLSEEATIASPEQG